MDRQIVFDPRGEGKRFVWMVAPERQIQRRLASVNQGSTQNQPLRLNQPRGGVPAMSKHLAARGPPRGEVGKRSLIGPMCTMHEVVADLFMISSSELIQWIYCHIVSRK